MGNRLSSLTCFMLPMSAFKQDRSQISNTMFSIYFEWKIKSFAGEGGCLFLNILISVSLSQVRVAQHDGDILKGFPSLACYSV